MKRANARDEEERSKEVPYTSAVVIAASIIAAVRLAREENISTPTPRVVSTVYDSVSLARMILRKVIGHGIDSRV